jgi:hypothetical protein
LLAEREREPVGPGGRTFDEVTGKDYLSQEERAWYLATLAQRQGPPPPTLPPPPPGAPPVRPPLPPLPPVSPERLSSTRRLISSITPPGPGPANLPPAPGPPAFQDFQAEQGRALSLEGYGTPIGARGQVFTKPPDLPRRGPVSAALGDAANAALSFIGKQQPVGGGFGGPTVSEIGRAATVQPFREQTGDIGAAIGKGAGILAPSANPLLDLLGGPEKVGRTAGEELSPMLLDLAPVVGFGGDIARLGTAAARGAPGAARAVGHAPAAAGRGLVLGAKRGAPGITAAADIGLGPRLTPLDAVVAARKKKPLPGATAAGEGVPPSPGGPPAAAPPISPPAPGRAAPEVDFEQLRRDLGEAARTGKPQGPPAPGERLGLRPSQADRIEGLAAKPPKTTLALYKKDPAFVQKGTLEAALRDQGALPEGYFTKAQLSRRLERTLAEAKGAPARPQSAARPTPSDPLEEALAVARTGEKPPSARSLAVKIEGGPPGWIKDVGLSDDASAGLNYFVRQRLEILKNLAQNPNRARRAATKAATGIDDPWLAEVVGSEREMGDFLRQTLKDATPIEAEETIAAARLGFRDQALGARFKTSKDALAAKARLVANDVERMQDGIVGHHYDTVNNLLRTVLLGLELPVAFAGQQGLRAVRGAPAIASGVIARMVPGLRRQLYLARDVDFLAQAIADGGQFAKRGATADIRPDVLDRIPFLGDAANWIAAAQFEHALGAVRLRAGEGLLLQNWALRKLTLGRLGGDITSAATRRRIWDMANVFGSTARGAVGARRAAFEQRGLLSARMTRAQINEVLTPVRSLRSQEDAINTLNLIGGTATLFAAAHQLNEQIGIGSLVLDPAEFMFGRMVLDQRNSKGENISFDFLPQASLYRALAKTWNAYEAKDWEKLGKAWLAFSMGRLAPTLSDSAAAGGFGYGREGRQYYGEMPMEERVRAIAPLPIWIQSSVIEGETDLLSIALAQSGANSFGESEYGEQLRRAREDYGVDHHFDLLPYQRAEQNMKIAGEGRELLPEEHASPYMYAGTSAFGVIQEQVQQKRIDLGGDEQFVLQFETMKQAREAYVAQAMKGAGLSFTAAQDDWFGFLGAMGYTDIVRQMREEAIRVDPSIVDSLDALYQSGDAQWPVPKWARELAAEVNAEGMGIAAGQ